MNASRPPAEAPKPTTGKMLKRAFIEATAFGFFVLADFDFAIVFVINLIENEVK